MAESGPSGADLSAMAEQLAAEGWGVIPPFQYRMDVEPAFRRLWEDVEDCTMTSLERGYALHKAVQYVCARNVPGDLVECGVWRGGSCMIIARTLLDCGRTDKTLYMYDTYEGMTRPTEEDVIAWNDSPVTERWEQGKFASWAAGLEEVRRNMSRTGYPADKITFVAGDVTETLNETRPKRIALLRLDTDWYESTAKELELLYPALVDGGVIIIDDYGHFKGARKAVDEYFHGRRDAPLLTRVDYTGRVGVKVPAIGAADEGSCRSSARESRTDA